MGSAHCKGPQDRLLIVRYACFVPVLSMKRTYSMDTIRKMSGLSIKMAVFMDRNANQPGFYVEPIFTLSPKNRWYDGGTNVKKNRIPDI